jgi:hypothetical protein
VSYDDTVTSVTNAGDGPLTPASLEDEVVDQSIISFEEDYDDEQDERRDLLYRDSRSAIERARQRHVQRRQQPIERDEDTVISQGVEQPDRSATLRREPVFEPDDFIEEEAPKPATTTTEHDDALISEGVRTPTPRSLRLRRFRDEQPLPKKDLTATKIEPDFDRVEMELPPSAAPERGRFDSVPEFSADIELPLLRRSSSADQQETPATMSATPESETYERALKRAHDLRAAARLERNQEQRAHAPAVLREAPQQELMPNLPEANPISAANDGRRTEVRPDSTSAILHPRARREQPSEPISRTLLRAQPSDEPRPAARPSSVEAPAREVRQSWWRGSRRSSEPSVPESTAPIRDSAPSLEPELAPLPQEMVETPRRVEMPPVVDRAPEPVTFDLAADDGMDSFRDRLFASTPVTEAPVAPQRRTPISVARRPPSPASAGTPARRVAPGAPAQEAVRISASEGHARPHWEDQEEALTAQTTMPAVTRDATPAGPTAVAARRAHDAPRPMRGQRSAPARPRTAPIQPEALLDDPRDAWLEPEPVHDFDVRRFLNEDSTLLDMTIKIAPGVPRACATCRNYRPSEQEGRGWCTNEWAFTHRQMVNETDLACDSTIGCWWLPSDRATWLEDLEVPTESTPRVDRLLAHLNPERRMVGN